MGMRVDASDTTVPEVFFDSHRPRHDLHPTNLVNINLSKV